MLTPCRAKLSMPCCAVPCCAAVGDQVPADCRMVQLMSNMLRTDQVRTYVVSYGNTTALMWLCLALHTGWVLWGVAYESLTCVLCLKANSIAYLSEPDSPAGWTFYGLCLCATCACLKSILTGESYSVEKLLSDPN